MPDTLHASQGIVGDKPEWRLSSIWAAVMAAVTNLTEGMAGPGERWILLGSSLDRAGFPAVGTQQQRIGGDGFEAVVGVR